MEGIGEVSFSTLTILGKTFQYNHMAVFMTWIVAALILGLAYVARKHLTLIPGKIQSLFEMIYDFLKEITIGTLGEEDGKKYLPFIVTLFIFILTANYIGLIPNIFKFVGVIVALLHKLVGGNVAVAFNSLTDIQVVAQHSAFYSFLLNAPDSYEPTRSVNMDLALATLVFFICHALGIRKKGLGEYLKGYISEPFPSPLPLKGAWLILAVINPVVYFNLFMNLIGVVSTVVSHAFRLFGNIFGGSMIIVIVSTLLKFF